MGKKLKKDFLMSIKKNLEKEEMLIEYANNLPDGYELIQDLGSFKNFELIEGLDIKDVEVVKIKNSEHKEMIKILSEIDNKKLSKKELEELVTINEKEEIELAEKLEKSLAIYDKASLLKLTQTKDICLEKLSDNELKINDKYTIEKEEDKEKVEIANSIGEEPDNILNIVRINDRYAGSKLFDTTIEHGARVNLVRLTNNKFKLLEERQDGKYTELKGYEVTPVSKELFPSIASQFDKTSDLNVGDVRTGKTRIQERYNIFQIKGRGDTGEGNSLLYVGVNDKSQMDMMENRDNGYEFERVKDLNDKYPRKVIVNGKEEKVYVKEVEEKKENVQIQNNYLYKDYLMERYKLEQKLLETEEEIDKILDSEEDKDDELSVLYNKRTDILSKLNLDEKEFLEEMDIEHENTHRPVSNN